ncbi:MAG: ATP-dependent helicase [Dysgonamonadaceae bacterium]|jgi:superfamily I DNA/RNA helicase|nr:ATP-dependent helicase [Dysgonamonadaceae bacterium]
MLRGLNEQQKDAVLTDGHVLLTACPGSGKTRVLTYKLAYELQKIGDTKKRAVALTFTNRAADEIKRRIVHMDIDPTKLWAGTIHAFCLEWILRPYASYLDELKNGFVISDEYKTEELLSFIKKEFEEEGILIEKPWDIKTRLDTNGNFMDLEPTHLVLLEEYHNRLVDEGLIDFDQILYYAFKLVNSYPKIAKTLNNLFHIICVDEYQDTSNLQYAILSKIITAKEGKTILFLVGDKDQAIYGSLGGVAKSLNEIKSEFENLNIQEKELSGNYRSCQRIIDYYRNYQTADIEIESLCSHADESGLITFNNILNKDDLDKYIASVIEDNLNSGIPEHEICVLAPQWWMVIPMGRKLKTLLPQVNFDAYGLSPLLRNKENIWFKVARLFLVEPSLSMYFVRNRWASELIEEFDILGIRILDNVDRKSKSLLRIINSISSTQSDGLAYIEECFNALLMIIEVRIDEHPTLKQHWEYFFEGTKKRLKNPEFDYAKDTQSFKRLFKQHSGVVVNTCHGVKGEEFHTVIAFGLLHGFVPNWGEDDPSGAGKKLLYVICSRAKKYLHLISENGRTTKGGKPYETTGHLKRLVFHYD